MADPVFIKADVVASKIGCGKALFLRQRQTLEVDHGFPPPLPHLVSPMKWRASEVDAWIDRQGYAAPPLELPPVGNISLIEEARRA